MNAADRLAALREAATPGPWAVRPQDGDDEYNAIWSEALDFDEGVALDLSTIDAAYIVALVNAGPALEALVRAAEAHAAICRCWDPAPLRAALTELGEALA